MSKKESTFINMVTTLFLVTLISSAAVGFVYEKTKEPLAVAKLAKKVKAIQAVVPEFDNSPLDEKSEMAVDGGMLIFYPAKKNSQLVGTAVETFSTQGFGGEVKLMVGFLPDGTINGIEIIEQKETPGLGDKMEKNKSGFARQFEHKHPASFHLKVKKDGGDVDGITAATISSRAFCDAVQRAYNIYTKK